MHVSVLAENRDGALVLTINRPDAGNALNPAVGRSFVDALADAAGDAEVRSIIVTGAGDKIFCAGMDLKAFVAGEDMTAVGEGLRYLTECPKPVIAAVNGAAVAGGFEVVLRCDLVVAVEHAKFGIPEVKRGLVAAGGGTRLPTRIPLQIALELGLVNRVVPAGRVLDEALALAALINANGPLAVQATKRLMREEVGPDNSDHVRQVTAPVFASVDAREGATAFAEKRQPIWKGI
jgi:enoyl-CoA hydratase